MASTRYDSIKELRKGKYDQNVQARLMNLWRGYTKQGEPFKAFNLLLVDGKVIVLQKVIFTCLLKKIYI